MQTLIPVLNKLQDVFTRVGNDSIHLPQIVVVGCQSCGKSSVLESLVQKDFLPRGSGIVTRRPLILQLIHSNGEEYATFLHLPDKKFTNFDEVRKEIEDETERVCHQRGVTDVPINLKVYSPNVLNLTLVDLPGLTKVATEGQDKDLPKLIEAMVLKYITPPNSIILAISPANSDIANSDSLSIAKRVDPNGERTIGVLTKLDIMDKGTSARDILMNKTHTLKLGYIGVVNRSQQDINLKKPMKKVLEEEHRFFVTNQEYADIADVNGYPYLANTLNQILLNHIKKNLPVVHNEINELLRRKNAELESYGESFGDNIEEQQMFLYRMIEHYLTLYNSILLGTSDELIMTGFDGGYNLMSYLITDYPAKLNSIPLPSTMRKEDVSNMIEANSGIQRALFFPEATFNRLIIEYIEKLRAPSTEAAEMVHHRLMELHEKVHLAELDRFPKAKSLLSQSILDIAKENLEECMTFIKDFIDMEESYINSEHPVFKEKTKASLQSGSLQSNVDLLLELVERYFIITKKEVEDQISKGIHLILIKKSTENLRHELFKRLVLKPNLTEDPEIAERRKKCISLIKALKEASSILNEVRMTRV